VSYKNIYAIYKNVYNNYNNYIMLIIASINNLLLII